MIQDLGSVLAPALGLGADELTAWQMALRAAIVYVTTLGMVRLGEKRFLGKSTPFDVILGIMLGSIVSRAITGSSPFFPTLVAGGVLVTLHWAFAALAFRSDRLATLIKGNPRVLVEDGEIIWEAMRKSHVGSNDLLGALRLEGRVQSVEDVRSACLERSGDISVIKKRSGPRVIEVAVSPGVQTVRLRID